jgi:hypothetical protein
MRTGGRPWSKALSIKLRRDRSIPVESICTSSRGMFTVIESAE